MSIKLTATQQAILNHAHQHTAGRIDWFPETLKGGAKAKTVESMVKAGLISKNKRATVMTKAAYAGGALLAQAIPLCHPTAGQLHVLSVLKRFAD